MSKFWKDNAVAIVIAIGSVSFTLLTLAYTVGGKSAELVQVQQDVKEIKIDVKDIKKAIFDGK